ncbi:TrmH family RNA methyltransferase [Bacteroides ihuae]|uniref:TrmH family RNA methyltransferase n=1 Tax=Bacteroides ihuae TaxID=1852362 RepID=UPI0008DA9ADB
MPLSKNKIKYIHSLEQKKIRKEENSFLGEGPKLVGDLLGHFPCRYLAATTEWLSKHPSVVANEIVEVSAEELSRASLLKTPQQVLAIFEQSNPKIEIETTKKSLSLALDDIQDPGNLGTIIRLADWFGIEQIFCSLGTVDVYNPKTIQATMGAIARVKVHYTSLPDLIALLKDIPVYGTFLDGENIYQKPLAESGIIIMGNEGNGISKEVENLINHRLYIPNYPQERETSESLNVAIATAVVCGEFRRQMVAPSQLL